MCGSLRNLCAGGDGRVAYDAVLVMGNPSSDPSF